jgi:phosphoribosyl-AMP cyclohydrolase
MPTVRFAWAQVGAALLVALTLAAPANASSGKVNPNQFVSEIDNPYLPFEPGTEFRFRGEVDGDPSTDTETVTNRHKEIDGVSTLAVHDEVAVKQKVIEKTDDYYAQDKKGNVWYFGEDSFELQHGKFVRADDSWQAGVNGAKPGIIMEADPQVGDTYTQEDSPGVAEDRAKVLSLDKSVTVPYGSFDHVLKTEETSPLDPQVEDKFYARGVGELKEVVVKHGNEHYELVSVTH